MLSPGVSPDAFWGVGTREKSQSYSLTGLTSVQ
uniref:Uncharacterized protein n=1 Tax=Anguilla anguilla TaxID=7936 RepID=A0A0E9U9G1_ANGAN